MFAYSGFIGRSVYILIDGYEKGKIEHWKKDDGIDQIVSTALNEKEFKYIKSLKVHSFDSMLQLLENKILKEINRLISSEDFTNNSLEELKKINSILDQGKKSGI